MARTALALAAFCVFEMPLAQAQESELRWGFSQDNVGKSATLGFNVPETDNSMAYGFCDGKAVPNGARLMLAANVGAAEHNAQTKLRISGGGQEFEFDGKAVVPESGEGITGVSVDVKNDHPVWAMMQNASQFSVQVPGYAGAVFPLVGGQTAIADFNGACKSFAQNSGVTVSNSDTPSGGLPERAAFDFARELDSPEAWRAFLKVYPEGFFAELAKGYLKRQQTVVVARPVQPSKPTPNLAPKVVQPLQVRAGASQWYNFNYQQDEGNASSYAAGVRAGDVEFFAWCSPNRMMNFGMRAAGNNQQRFDEVMAAVQKTGNPAQLTLQNGTSINMPMQVYGLNGEVGFPTQHQPAGNLVERMMRDSQFSLVNGIFSGTFQLKGSRKAICDVINRCGAIVNRCQRPAAAPPTPVVKKTRPAIVCRSRSVFIEGRGCVLRSSLNRKPRTKKRSRSCPRGQRRFRGNCLFPAEIANYCGPGFRLLRGRCVRNARKPRPAVRMLKRNSGGFISVTACRRRGMTEEFGYCVEDD